MAGACNSGRRRALHAPAHWPWSSDTRLQLKYMASCAKEHPPLDDLALRHQACKEIIQRGLRIIAQSAVHRRNLDCGAAWRGEPVEAF